MKQVLHVFLFVMICWSLTVWGDARDISHMNEILPLIDNDTLVVFDLDNTVIHPSQTLASDQWFKYLIRQMTALGVDDKTATDKAISIWLSAQRATSVQPVEKDTPAIIQKLQERGIKMMALTARPIELASTTHDQLKSVAVDFTKSPAWSEDLQLTDNPEAKLIGGILFIGPRGNKGTELVQFLKQINSTPKKIVFIDDQVKHVQRVEAALTNLTVEHISLRYGADDEHVQSFDPAVADRELGQFVVTGQLMPDQAARCANLLSGLKN